MIAAVVAALEAPIPPCRLFVLLMLVLLHVSSRWGSEGPHANGSPFAAIAAATAGAEAWGAYGPVEVYGGPQLDVCEGAPPRGPLQWAHLVVTPQLSPSEDAFAAAAQDVYLRIHGKGRPLRQWGEALQALTQWLEGHQSQREELQDLTTELFSLLGSVEARRLLQETANVEAPVFRPAVLLLSLLRLLQLGEQEQDTYKIPAAAAMQLTPNLARTVQRSLGKALPEAVSPIHRRIALY